MFIKILLFSIGRILERDEIHKDRDIRDEQEIL